MKPHKVTSAFKHVFIPHEANEYKPHFFREVAVITLLSVGIFLLGVSAGSSLFLKKTVLGASITASVLVDLANESRIAYNEQPLNRNIILDRAAQLKGEDMVAKGYFAHNSPEGVTPWHWLKQAGYVFLYAGENLAINYLDSQEVNNAWLNSPKHRENLLNVKFREIGIATIEGVYKDNPTIYVVQMFGTPASVMAETKKVATTSKTIISTSTTVASGSPTLTIAIQSTPEVKGDTSKEVEPTSLLLATTEEKTVIGEPISTAPSVITLSETPEFAVVQNSEEVRTTETSSFPTTNSPWYGKLLFNGSDYIDTIYKIFSIIIVLALLTMIFIEVRRQHFRHIAYGCLLLGVISILIYVNKTFINFF